MPSPLLRRRLLMAKAATTGFDPTTIPGLKVWLKADSLSLSDGQNVATWSDSSGNGNNATNTLGGTRPPIYKANILNGKPIVRFTAANSQFLKTAAYGSALLQPNTLFAVVKQNSLTSYFAIDSLSSGSREYLLLNSSGKADIYAGNVDVIGATNFQGSYTILSLYYNGSSSEIFVDGGTGDATGNAGANGMDGMYIGSSFGGSLYLDGDIAEILLYNALLTSTQRRNVEGYLSQKYGIAVT